MLILLWLLAGLSLGQSETVAHQIEQSINRTIDTVEKLIQDDPTLPRLSRPDILNILLNISSGNPELAKIEQITRTAYRNVISPHSALNNPKNTAEESKSPLFQMIPDSKEADAIVEIGKTEEIVFPPNPKDPSPFVEKSDKWIAESSVISPRTSTMKIECKTVHEDTQNNHRHSYSEPPKSLNITNSLNNAIRSSSEPEKFTFNLANLDQITKSAQEYLASNKTGQLKNEKVAIVYSTSVTQKPNANKNNDKAGTPTNYPQLYDTSANVLRLDQWQYVGPSSGMKNEKSDGRETESEKVAFLPTVSNYPENMQTYFEIPKKIAGSYSNINEVQRPAPVYVTPLSSQDQTINMEKDNMNNKMPGGFSIATKIETSVKPLELMNQQISRGESVNEQTNEVKVHKNIVESSYNTPGSSKFNLPLNVDDYGPSDMQQESTILDFNPQSAIDNYKNIFKNGELNIKNLNIHDAVGLSPYNHETASITKQNTFESPQLDFKKGIDNLSPDVRALFQRFGLPTSLKDIVNESQKVTTTTTRRPTTTSSYLDSFTSFKRLPASQVENKEMRDFLAQFGLGSTESRNHKSMKSNDHEGQSSNQHETKQLASFDMRKALDNIGLLALVPRSDEVTVRSKPKQSSTKKYVFKPHETSTSSSEQREKINKLLNTVKMVQEGKVDDVQKVVEDLVQTTKSLKSGPDPVNLDEILKLYNEEMRKDRKHQRQAVYDGKEDASTSTSTTSTEATSTEESSTQDLKTSSTEQTSTTVTGNIFDMLNVTIPEDTKESDSDAKAAMQPDNFAALEESFGGTTAAPDPVVPTRPRTGLYFLVDWNTFLEVGEEDKDKVNLRFQPKVGDRTRFIPIKVP